MNEKLESPTEHSIYSFEQWTKIDPALLKYIPDFFVITPPRSGSTWLFENLRCHSEIFIPPFKEVKYFSTYWKMCDINWYLECFKEGREKKKGDVSPSYTILTDEMLQSIKHIIPNLHVIILFRDPIERSWSHAKHQFRFKESVFASFNEIYENVPESKIIDCLTNTWMMAYSDYLSILRRWAAIFPKENIYINFFDSIISTPQSLLENVFQHIGVSKDIDWLKLPLHERFFQGIEQEVPVKIKNILLSLYHARMKEFANYLLDVFDLKIPKSWDYIIDAGVKNKELYKLYFSNDNNQVILDDVLRRELIQSLHVQLLKEDYKGFKIIAFKGDCLAIAKVLDGIDIIQMSKTDFEKLKREGKILCGETLNEVLSLINTMKDEEPFLVKEGYKGFNIVAYNGKYYAVAQSLGVIDFTLADLKIYKDSLQFAIGESIDDAMRHVDKLTIFKDEITDRASRIEALQEEITQKSDKNTELQALLEENGEKLSIAQQELSEKDRKVVSLQGEAAERDSTIEGLRKEIEDKEASIVKLQTEITDRASKIEALQGEVAERDRDIERQRKDIEDKETGIVKLQTELTDRDVRIEGLQGEVSERDEGIRKLNEELQSRHRNMDVLQKEIGNKDSRIDNLQKEASERDNIILGQEKELKAKESRIIELQNNISDRDSKIEALQRDVTERDNAIQRQRKEIEDKEAGIVKLQAEMSDRDARIEALQGEMSRIKALLWFRLYKFFGK